MSNIQPACIWGNNAHSSSKSFPRLFIWPMKFQRPIKMLCCYTLSCSFAHTRTSCSAWRVAGYLGNLSTKYLLVTAGTPDHNISGSQTAESSSLPPNSGNMIWEHVKDLLFFLWKVGNILIVALFFFWQPFFIQYLILCETQSSEMATIASKQDSYYWSHLWTNLKPFVTLYCLKAVFNKHYFILI